MSGVNEINILTTAHFLCSARGEVLEPMLFNISLCDLFLLMEDIDCSSYADDNTPYILLLMT